MINKYLALMASWALLGLAQAHIHSQKIHLKRSELSPGTWLYALVSSALVAACGILPLLFSKWIRLEGARKNSRAFRLILSFSVGGLLGDVFLHLLPEAYGAHHFASDREAIQQASSIGLWVIIGVLVFLAVEKMMMLTNNRAEDGTSSISVKQNDGTHLDISSRCMTFGNTNSNCEDGTSSISVKQNDGTHLDISSRCMTFGNTNSNCNSLNGVNSICNGLVRRNLCNNNKDQTNGFTAEISDILRLSTPSTSSSSSRWLDKDASGYLNLAANFIDNFTHGLAIAAGYVVSPAVGMLTTVAILCHEVPHEVGDFVILINSGFSWREAAKAQMLTACGGFVGVGIGLTADHVTNISGWLLPFTAGGFLYIALVSIIPDLLEVGGDEGGSEEEAGGEEKKRIWLPVAEVFAMGMGIFVMALVTIVERKSCNVPSHVMGT